MSLSTVKSQLSSLERRLDAVQGKGTAIEYIWSSVAGGVKTIHAGNPNSMAHHVIEIMVTDTDGPGDAPRIYFDGEEQNISHALPAITLDEVMSYE